MAKKRLSMFDAMDGALAKVGGLREAAEKVKTIPFRAPSGKQPQAATAVPAPAQVPQAEAKPVDPQPETLGNALGSGLGNDFDNALDNSTTPSASTSTTPSASTAASTATTPSTADWATPSAPVSTTPSAADWATPSASPTDKAAYVSGRKAQALAHLLTTRPADGVHIVRYPDLVAALGIPYKTIRWAMTELERDGFFKRKDYRNGMFQGVELAYDEHLCRRYCERIKPSTTPSAAIWATPSATASATDRAAASTTPSASTTVSATHYKEKIDRENLSIFLSAERIALTWPHLARSGFGPDQLAQIGQALAELGKTTDKVLQSLDHAEWELEHDQMRDKDAQPVADPCSWVFRSLARTGYYRRPKGYVSPEEQAAKDAEAEAKAVTAARHAAEQARFEAWRDRLSPEELADAMRGHPGGPRDAWLKTAWKKTR